MGVNGGGGGCKRGRLGGIGWRVGASVGEGEKGKEGQQREVNWIYHLQNLQHFCVTHGIFAI